MSNGIEHLLDLKSRLELSTQQLSEEHSNLKEKIIQKREARIALQSTKAEDTQRLYQLRVAQLELNKQADIYEHYVADINGMVDRMDAKIKDSVRIQNFEQEAMKLITDYDGAMEYFRDDSLQMELMKRSNSVRERRVEYTVAENEYKEMLRKIEDRKREKERKEMAEKERLREIEEQEKRERFLKSRVTFKKSPSPIERQETKIPEILDGSLSQFMRW